MFLVAEKSFLSKIIATKNAKMHFSAFSAMPENAGENKTRFAIHFFAGGLRRVIADQKKGIHQLVVC